MKNRLPLFLSLVVCLAVLLYPAYGQEVTAGIYGTVQDATGAVIPGAEIVMTNVDTGRTLRTTSDPTGGFTITLVPLGNYDISAESTGFRTSVVTGVTLRVNDNRRIIFNLAVGDVSESITVEASAVTVNTASGETSAHLDGKELINIPSTGRYVLPFAMLMPGVVSDRSNSRRDNRAAVNGIRPTPGCSTGAITSTPAATGARRWLLTSKAWLSSARFAATIPPSSEQAVAASSMS
jgi:Carboxypeptidase regulatory-like domain